jgi:acyl carrier protein
VPPDRFEVDRPLSELGLDSLMTVELINWVEEVLDFRLPTVELMKNPTTVDMARLLLNLYNKKLDETKTSRPPVTTAAS